MTAYAERLYVTRRRKSLSMCNHCEETNWKDGRRRTAIMTAKERQERDVIDAGSEKLKVMIFKAMGRHQFKANPDQKKELELVERDATACANLAGLVDAQSDLWYAEFKIAHPEVNEWHGMHLEDKDSTVYEILPGECRNEPQDEDVKKNDASIKVSIGNTLDAVITSQEKKRVIN